MTSWPSASSASAASSASVNPDGVGRSPCSRPAASRFFATNRVPPARCISVATYLPPGVRLVITGVRAETRLKSLIVRGTPASRASASRCRTEFVEPPVAAAPAIAFSNASLVRMSEGRTPLFSSFTIMWPASNADFVFFRVHRRDACRAERRQP